MKPHINTLLYSLRLPENNLRDISPVEIKVVFRGIIVMLVLKGIGNSFPIFLYIYFLVFKKIASEKRSKTLLVYILKFL